MKIVRNILLLTVLLLAGTLSSMAQSKVIAFPGAEGFGRYATGGRGGTVKHVTNLNDSGTGSLRAALSGTAKKIIVFDVSGTIHLKSELPIYSNTTIAGQSAPGDGICIADCPCTVKGDNIIVRYMRFRLGNKNITEAAAASGAYDGWDGFGALDHNNIIVDHCSVSWSIDECLSMSGCKDITVQWCLVGQSMVKGHSKLSHGYGGNWGGAGSSYHHNLLAHHNSRTPRVGPGTTTQLDERMDMRNNVIYNYGGNGCYGGEAMKVNIVNNYYKPGAATKSKNYQYRIAAPGIRTTDYCKNDDGSWNAYYPAWHIWGKYYVTGNVNPNYPELSASDANQWNMGIYEQIDASGNDGTFTAVTKDTIRITEPINYVAVTTHSAEQAYEKVLQYAGASLHRDAFDEQMVSDTRNGTATATGSGNSSGIINTQDDNTALIAKFGSAWPTLNSETAPTDTDGDGIPDSWETAHGLNPNDATDGSKQASGTWYTNVEVYLNSIVEDITNAQNEGGAMMGETLEGESSPVAYTISEQTFQSESDGLWNFGEVSMNSGFGHSGYSFNTIQVNSGTQYTISIPEGVSITSVTVSGYSNNNNSTTYLNEVGGTDVSAGNYTFPKRTENKVNTYTISLASPATSKLTFTCGGSARTCLTLLLNGIKEGSGIQYDPEDTPTPTPPPTGETSEYTISPATHSDEAWGFGDVSITISGKDYSEGHVSSDFTGIKFSRNTNYTINLPDGVAITSVDVKGYSNGDGTAYVATLGDNTFTADDYTYASKVTSSHTYVLTKPATGTMVFRPSGDNQMVATLTLHGTTTGIFNVTSNARIKDNRLYNLQGIQVTHPKKGIYIYNGKKIIVN